jgi:hypothetical protein
MGRFTDQTIGGQGPQAGDSVPAVVVMGADGKPAGGSPSSYTLLTAASATGQPVSGIRGGDYVWQIEGTWGGATATLERRALDGVNWKTVRNQANTADASATADTQMGLGIGQGAEMRVRIAGATAGTTNLNSVLSGLS